MKDLTVLDSKEWKKTRAITIAVLFEPALGLVKVGWARCSMEDQFNKKIGRAIALGRAKAALGKSGRSCLASAPSYSLVDSIDISSREEMFQEAKKRQTQVLRNPFTRRLSAVTIKVELAPTDIATS